MTNQAITKANMIGILGLSIANAELEDFNSISLMVQNEVARTLLGDELYNDFTSDFDAGSGTPTEQKWIDFLNGVTYTDTENYKYDKELNSDGINEAWKYFVYYEWLNQAPFVSNFIGKSVHNTTNSTVLDRQSLNAETQYRYNVGVEVYERVKAFLKYYEEIQVDIDSTSIVTSNPDFTNYKVDVSSTKYLKLNDRITIDGVDYEALDIIADTSFTFNAPTTVDFTNGYVTWYPFYEVALGKKEPIYFNGMI